MKCGRSRRSGRSVLAAAIALQPLLLAQVSVVAGGAATPVAGRPLADNLPSWALLRGYVRPDPADAVAANFGEGVAETDASLLMASPVDGASPEGRPRRLVRRNTPRQERSLASNGVDARAAFVDVNGDIGIARDMPSSETSTVEMVNATSRLPQGHVVARSPLDRSKVFIIMTGDKPGRSLKQQASWIQHVKWPDKVLFACGQHCREDPRLESVLVVPDLINVTSVRQPSQDYRHATMRGPWAMQWLWKEIERMGTGSQGTQLYRQGSPEAQKVAENDGFGVRLASEQFKWWIIADDDTFVNMPVLERVLAKYNTSEPVMLAQGYSNGGPGLAISKAAVKAFVPRFWDYYIPRWRNEIKEFYGDGALIGGMKDAGVRIVDPPEFSQVEPSKKDLEDPEGKYRSFFATWHHAWEHRLPDDYEQTIYAPLVSERRDSSMSAQQSAI
jgi:hypothetical protein